MSLRIALEPQLWVLSCPVMAPPATRAPARVSYTRRAIPPRSASPIYLLPGHSHASSGPGPFRPGLWPRSPSLFPTLCSRVTDSGVFLSCRRGSAIPWPKPSGHCPHTKFTLLGLVHTALQEAPALSQAPPCSWLPTTPGLCTQLPGPAPPTHPDRLCGTSPIPLTAPTASCLCATRPCTSVFRDSEAGTQPEPPTAQPGRLCRLSYRVCALTVWDGAGIMIPNDRQGRAEVYSRRSHH